MPEPEQHPNQDVGDMTDETPEKREPISPPTSDAGPSFSIQPTELHPQTNPNDAFHDDSFDRSLLAASSNHKSLGKLGKYEVLELIGQGGMGVVLRGLDESLGRQVAIKVLSRQLAGSSTARRRFTREGRAVAAIRHPNVITIHAVEEQNGQPFLVMEFVNGGSLHDRIKQHAPLSLAEVLRIGAQIASGLAAAHEQGIIHRDIKPGNVMLEEQVDRIKITDFGLARITMDNSDLTSQGNQLGTPAYMSPEQVQGHEVDHRTDLFSLGCVLYAMILGRSPFRGTHAFDTAQKILAETPVPLNELNETVPPFLAEIVSRLLEKDRKKRYQSASEVAEVLNHYLAKLNQTRTDQLDAFQQGSLSRDSSKRSLGLILGLLLLGALTITAAATASRWLPPAERTEVAGSEKEFRESTSADASNISGAGTNRAGSSVDESGLGGDRDAVDAEGLEDLFEASFQSGGTYAGSGNATGGIGNMDPADYYIVHPQGWPLVGFNFTIYEFKNEPIIKTLQPIFRSATGELETSEMIGRLNPKCEFRQVIAKPGYAVCGMEGVGGKRLHSIKVTFRRTGAGGKLADEQDETYESPWYGGTAKQQAQIVGGSDALAIGIVCSFNVDVHQLGLILADSRSVD